MKLSDIIVIVMLAVPILRYSVAFQQAEPALLTPWGELDISYITGLAFGISYEAAIYYGLREGAASRKRGSLVKTWLPSIVASGVQSVVGVIIVIPVLVAYLQNRTLGILLGNVGSWIWSLFVAVASLVCFVTVSLALAIEKEETKPQQTETKPKQKKFVCDYPGCDFETRTHWGLNGHKRKHNKEDDF